MADKKYSVGIDVDLNTDKANEKILDLIDTMKQLKFGTTDVKIAVGGYTGTGGSDGRSGKRDRLFDQLNTDIKSGSKGLRSAIQDAGEGISEIAEEFGFDLDDAGEEIGKQGQTLGAIIQHLGERIDSIEFVDVIEDGALDVKRALNDAAQELARVLKISYLPDYASVMGEPEFAVPMPRRQVELDTPFDLFDDGAIKQTKLIQQQIDDFLPGKDGTIVISPAMFLNMLEGVIRENPEKFFSIGGYVSSTKPSMERQMSSGVDRSVLGDSKQAENVIKRWQEQLSKIAKNPELLPALESWMDDLLTSISMEVWEAALEKTQDSADYFASREFKGSIFEPNYIPKSEATDISSGSNEFGFWIEEQVKNLRQATLERGFAPGSDVELAGYIRRNLESKGPLSFQEEAILHAIDTFFVAIESGFQNLNTDIADQVPPLAAQVFGNPAIVTTKPLDDGAQKEIKQLTAEIPAQVKQIQELGTAAIGAAESVKSLKEQAKEASDAQIAVSMAEFDLESNKEDIAYLQRIADDETKDLRQRASAAESIQAKVLEQAELEKKLIELRAKQTALQLSSVKEETAEIETVAVEKKKVRKKKAAKPVTEEIQAAAEPAAAEMTAAAKPVEGALRDISSTVIDGLMQILASGKKFIAAYDSEFVDATASVITEAAVVLMDETGKFYNVMDLLHAPPASQEGIWAQARVGTSNMKQLQKRAEDLGYQDPLGAGGGLENLQDFYPKLKALIDVINKLAELGIPLATAAGQGADFNRLAKAIQNVNEGIVENKLDLQPLLAPAGPYGTAMAKYPLAFQGGHDPRGLSTEADIQKLIREMTGPEAGRMKAAADGKVKVGALVRVLYDNLAEDVKSLITLTEEVDKKTGQLKLGFTLSGDPAHTARADAKATAAILAYISSISGAAPSPARPKTPKEPTTPNQPPLGPEGRVQSGIPDNGYEPFLIQLKGMNSVLSSMHKTEQEIFLEKLKQFKNTEGQEKLYERIAALNEEIAALQKVGGPDSKKKADELQKEISRLELLGEANERRLASEVKFNARQDKFAGDNYDTFKQQVDGVYAVEEADKNARASIIRGIKEQVAAEKEVEKQTKSLLNTWVTGRYALYDVGNAYAGVARQLWMASRQIFNITQAYRSYETAFTSVERAVQPFATTLDGIQQESESLKNSLIGLSETIPVAFEDLASIATLGAQMGVAASGIVGFTETVSKFSAVTGVSAETVAQKFGRIAELANVDYSEFNNLGSSILYAGINAVATESEIMTLAESIAAVSEQAGMVPSEIVGMATALASTGIQAEQARGVFTRVFADIDRAVSVGGKELTAFASVAGMSAQDFQQAWGTEGASYDVFRAILGGLG